MTIIQLETFLKITETGSFTAAANLLGYAQSTVTTQIQQLEAELGCPLFERLGKTVVLTAEGERLSAYAEKMMQLEREIMLEVPGNRPGCSGSAFPKPCAITGLPKPCWNTKGNTPGWRSGCRSSCTTRSRTC